MAKQIFPYLFRSTFEKINVHKGQGRPQSQTGIQKEVEDIYERVRKEEFPYRPSRLTSTFWSPSPRVFQAYSRPGGYLSRISAPVNYFLTSQELWSQGVANRLFEISETPEGLQFLKKTGVYQSVEDTARAYWRGLDPVELFKQGKEEQYFSEVLLPGNIKTEKQWSIVESKVESRESELRAVRESKKSVTQQVYKLYESFKQQRINSRIRKQQFQSVSSLKSSVPVFRQVPPTIPLSIPLSSKDASRTFFDIETGGFRGAQSPILSISWAKDREQVESLFAKPTPGTQLSYWSEKKIWEPLKSRGVSLRKEQEILMGFLKVLEGAPENTQLVGWNIGYVVAGQEQTRAGGFDIKMLMTRAKQFGLEERYRKALKKLNIVDIGSIYAYRIAKGIAATTTGWNLVQQGVLHPSLYQEAVGYVKEAGALAAKWGLTSEEEIAESLSRENIRFSGWKQELVFESIFQRPLSEVHQSEADVKALREIFESNKQIDEDFIRRWAKVALENKLVSRAKFVPLEKEEAVPARYTEIIEEAEKWGIRGNVESKLRALAVESGVPFSSIEAGKGIPTIMRKVGAAEVPDIIARQKYLQEGIDLVAPIIARHWGKIAIGAGVAATFITKPGKWFDDEDSRTAIEQLLTQKKYISAESLAKVRTSEEIEGAQARFTFLKKALKEYGVTTGGAMERVVFPKTFISQEELQGLGFVPVTIAVPESGQDIFQSLRHPYMTYHIHSHEKEWTMHKDEFASSTMLIERYKQQRARRRKDKDSLFEASYKITKEFVRGFPHLFMEGVPGLFYYFSSAFDPRTTAERIKQVLPQEYTQFMYGQTFSGKDDTYNTIEGLSHGGQAERMRKFITDFGSGYTGLLTIPKHLASIFQKARGGKGIEAGMQVGFKEFDELIETMRKNLGTSGGVQAQEKSIAKLVRERAKAQERGYASMVIINPEGVRTLAKQLEISPHAAKLSTITHERFHQTVTLLGLREKMGDVYRLYTKEIQPFLQERGARYIRAGVKEEGVLAEEFFAGAVGTSTLRGGPVSMALGREFEQYKGIQEIVSSFPQMKPSEMRQIKTETISNFPILSSFRQQYMERLGLISQRVKPQQAVAVTQYRQVIQQKSLSEALSSIPPPLPQKPLPTPTKPPPLPARPLQAKLTKPPPLPKRKTELIAETSLATENGTGAAISRDDIDSDFSSPINLNKVVSKAKKMYENIPVAPKLKSSILEPGNQKLRRKNMMQLSHRKAQVKSSLNALHPGKRHRYQTGKVVN